MQRRWPCLGVVLAAVLAWPAAPARAQSSAADLIASVPDSQAPLERYTACAIDLARRAAGGRRTLRQVERQLRPACGQHLLEARRTLLQARPAPAVVDQALRTWYAGLRVTLTRSFAPPPAAPPPVDDEETAETEAPANEVVAAVPVNPRNAPPIERLLPRSVPLPSPRPADLDAPRAPAAPAPPLGVPLPPEVSAAPLVMSLAPPAEPALHLQLPVGDILPVDRLPSGFGPGQSDASVATAALAPAVSEPPKPAAVSPPPAKRLPEPAPEVRAAPLPGRPAEQAPQPSVEAAIDLHRRCLARQIEALGDRFTVDRDLTARIARACEPEEVWRASLEFVFYGGDENQIRKEVADLTRMEIVTRLRIARRDAL